MSLPTLGDDLAMSLDNLTQQTYLGTVGIHHLDLLRLDAQDEISALGRSQRIHTKLKLQTEV